MISFLGAELITAVLMTEDYSAKCAVSNDRKYLLHLRSALERVKKHSIQMQLSPTLHAKLNRVIDLTEEDLRPSVKGNPQDIRWSILSDRVHEFLTDFRNEIGGYQLLAITPERKSWYTMPTEAFGASVLDAFPEAETDIRSAGQCFALDQWTACVFHNMRILELGLRSLATDLSLPDAEIEDWKNILDRIEKMIKVMDQEPRSADKTKRVQYYSEAVAQFRLFKDAFRNHVSHSRVSYDEQGADKILGGVRDFMEALVKKP